MQRQHWLRILLPPALAVLAALAPLGLPAGAITTVGLSQIDTSRLLGSQAVDLYVSVTDAEGQVVRGLPSSAFRIAESVDGRQFREIPGLDAFAPQPGATEGITFLLLIDNSGSMYDALDGRPTQDTADMRVTHAKDAVRRFLSSMTSPQDRVGLASYNTFYTSRLRPGQDRQRVAGLLEELAGPSRRKRTPSCTLP